MFPLQVSTRPWRGALREKKILRAGAASSTMINRLREDWSTIKTTTRNAVAVVVTVTVVSDGDDGKGGGNVAST